jgi:hypothetical protein
VLRRLVQDFPEVRSVPTWTLRALREIDPNAEMLYLGPSPRGGRWALGTMEPSNRELYVRAVKALSILARMPANRRDIRWTRRVRLEKAKLQGFRMRFVYECAEPGSAIVENVRHAHYDHLRTSDDDVLQAIEAQEAFDGEVRERDLTDPGRAREAHRYAFTQSHAPGISLTPARVVPSSRTAHPLPSPAA